MEFNSTIFGEILTVMDSPAADPNDARAKMDSRYSMVLVPGSVTRPDTTGLRNESHLAGTSVTVANGATAFSGFTTLRKGIWRITGSFYYVSSTVVAPVASSLRLNQNALSIGNLASIVPHTTIAVHGIMPLDVQVTIDRDTELMVAVGANAVGERTTVSTQVHCQRIA